MKTKYFTALFILLLLGVFFICPPAYSQSNIENIIDSATRESFRNIREEAEKELRTPPPKQPEIVEEFKRKPEEEGPSFLSKKIELEGVENVDLEEFQPLIEKYENKEINLQDLNILAQEIKREYLRHDIIAACYVPPQDVKEGVVKLVVVEAKMGKLIVNDHSFFDKDRIYFYWTIKPGEVLRYDKMSRAIQFMNKNPDREVTATLAPGEEKGTTNVILDVKTHFPIHPFFTYDREGVVSTGRNRFGFGGKYNNLLFVDDTIIVGYTVGRSFYGVYGYHSVPITNCGTSIMYGYSDMTSKPKQEFSPFGIVSNVKNLSFYVNQDLYKKAEYLGEFSIGMDIKDKSTKSHLGGTLNRDKLSIMRIKSTIIHRYPGTVTYMMPQISQGMNIFGARNRTNFSSRGASGTFTKFNMGINHRRGLPYGFQASLNFKSQWASEKLTPGEEFSLGGIDSVRGYPSGDYLADNAVQANFELHIPAFFIPEDFKLPLDDTPLKDRITGVVFFDYGYGERRAPLITEADDVSYAGIGPGVRVRLFKKFVFRFEWGFIMGDRPLTESADSRYHVSINLEY